MERRLCPNGRISGGIDDSEAESKVSVRFISAEPGFLPEAMAKSSPVLALMISVKLDRRTPAGRSGEEERESSCNLGEEPDWSLSICRCPEKGDLLDVSRKGEGLGRVAEDLSSGDAS